jgi:hypothetical protein
MMTATVASTESKALRLARYLREFVGLRSTTVFDVNKYESVLWFGDMPQEPECLSPAWNDGAESGDPWLVVHKQQFPKPPVAPEIILPWIDQQALRRAAPEMPALWPTRLESDLEAAVAEGEEAPLVERKLEDHPEVTTAYNCFRPNWEAWAAEYQRRSRLMLAPFRAPADQATRGSRFSSRSASGRLMMGSEGWGGNNLNRALAANCWLGCRSVAGTTTIWSPVRRSRWSEQTGCQRPSILASRSRRSEKRKRRSIASQACGLIRRTGRSLPSTLLGELRSASR